MNKVPAVLLLHGLWSSPSEILSIAKALRRTGYRVETPEICGYTYGAGAKVLPWREWLRAALAAFDSLAAEHESVSVGGLCVGGILSLAFQGRKVRADFLPAAFTTGVLIGAYSRLHRLRLPRGCVRGPGSHS